MNNQLKGGKRPLPGKKGPEPIREDELFGNMLKLDPDIAQELKDKGLEGRFVDAKKLYEANGYHPKGWRVYKRTTASGTIGSNEFKFGTDPDGIIRRGSLILAVKTKEEAEKHREFLRRKAALQSSVVPKAAEALRRTARENNVDTRVDETYDEDKD
jgi:hypothetical protein